MKQILLTLALLMLLSPAAVNAHNLFVRPLSGWADIGDLVILPIGAGHNTTASEMPENYVNISILRQDGGVIDHLVNNKTDTSGFWPVFDFNVESPGLYVISAYNFGGSWTHFITNPPAKEYWESGFVDDIDINSINKTCWANDWYIERSYPLNTYAKSFVAGPDSDFALASKPLGQILEIVPLDNITQAGKGNFQVQVLYKNNPFDNITVTAQKVGNDSKTSGVTDKDGKVSLNLKDSSEISEWIIVADTLMDPRVVEPKDLPRGDKSNEKTFVGPVYRATMVLRTDYVKPEA
jgi:uncharacterized GH25 family protein